MSQSRRKKAPRIHAETKATSDSKAATPPQESAQKLNEHFLDYFTGPIERLEHDLSIEHVAAERFRSAQEFIRACEKVGAWRLKQGEFTEDAGFFIGELARELAQVVHGLIERGDVKLARQLPPVVEILQSAMQPFGWKITGGVIKHLPIDRLLQKHKARDLLAMLAALYPDWDKIHHVHDRKAIEQMTENQLRELLLSKECWFQERDGKRTEQRRKHRLAETIENIVAVREAENENINLFVEQLWRGWLWGLRPDKSGSNLGKTLLKTPWHGGKRLPARDNVRAWMKIVMPFLKEVTGDDAMRLDVFNHLIAARKAVYIGDDAPEFRLANDKTDFIWNQVRTRIAQAWKTMANCARKRNSEKPA